MCVCIYSDLLGVYIYIYIYIYTYKLETINLGFTYRIIRGQNHPGEPVGEA